MVTIPIPPNHFISPSSLPSTSYNLSILTYNVLLPNSQDGWWNYKMYSYPESMTKETLKKQNQKLDQISNWSYRQELLKERIRTINSDVVCVQEVSPLSFEDDFAFMKDELGYDGMEIFKRCVFLCMFIFVFYQKINQNMFLTELYFVVYMLGGYNKGTISTCNFLEIQKMRIGCTSYTQG